MDWRWLAWQVYGGDLGRAVAQRYDWCLQSQWWPTRELQRYQRERLEEVLEHASRTVPYYRELGLGTRLTDYPVLSRQLIMREQSRLLSDEAPPGKRFEGTSSGSTGEPATIHFDELTFAWRRAALYRGDSWGASFEPTAPTVSLWGNPRDSRQSQSLRSRAYDWLYNRWIIHCWVMDCQQVQRIHRELHQRRPRFLYGYVSSLLGYIRFARELGLRPPFIEKVMPTAEQCTPEARAEIREFFEGAVILERYASREMGPMGHQCEAGSWHISCEHLYLEVQHPDGSISEDGRGSLLCTSLSNRLMPTIRYDIRDLLDLDGPPCPCGRGLPTFRSIEGRVAEHVYCPDGRWISSMAFTRFLRLTPFAKFRIVQDALEHVTLQVEYRGEISSELRAQVLVGFERLFEGQIRVDIEQLELIPPLRSGKSPHIVNLLRKERDAAQSD
ncbi:phenylacetate--CoA ligase family protein [bacterium]|nr:phenylacetate--CoA ligase family protein [bacterium]